MTRAGVLCVTAILGCAGHLPLRADLTSERPARTFSSQATPEERAIADIIVPVTNDEETYTVRIVIAYRGELVPYSIKFRLQDASGAPIDVSGTGRCGKGAIYYNNGALDPTVCELSCDFVVDREQPT